VDQKSEKLTCFCPKSGPQIQHSTNTTDQMTISSLKTTVTVHHCFDPLRAGEMDLQVVLRSFSHWQGGLWLRSLKNSPVFTLRFLPQVWATNPTLHKHHRPDDHLKTTVSVHHCFDPLEAGEMDLQVVLGSFGHWP
jgi:hypothetical protein